MPYVGAFLHPSLHALQIYGANTNVGKTIASTVLCRALRSRRKGAAVRYVKPVSTGPDWEADDGHITRHAKGVESTCLFQFDEPVSPHLAARAAGRPLPDATIVQSLHACLHSHASRSLSQLSHTLVETAGATLSPAPSGSLQADLYRPLRLPVLLVGDPKLGGIGATISAYESLRIRGYDVDGVVVFREGDAHADRRYGNYEYLREWFWKEGRRVPVWGWEMPPERHVDEKQDEKNLSGYYGGMENVEEVRNVMGRMEERHDERIKEVQSLPQRAHERVWYPFTQHQGRTEKDIMAIDSAHGDFFQTLSPPSTSHSAPESNKASESSAPPSLLSPLFDASASWWTQGLGHSNPSLAMAAAHAATRYGHVMFASGAHEPAVGLIEDVIQTLGNERLTRGFYSDDGSTAMEVALKMGLSAWERRTGIARGTDKEGEETLILGLTGSYHGDTIGVMDCSEPGVYNEKVSWYRGRGFWFDYPTVGMKDGKWRVEVPDSLKAELGEGMVADELAGVFDLEARQDDRKRYEAFILETLKTEIQEKGKRFGALIMEPVILGAGGMFFADPLFQATLVHTIRSNPSLFSDHTNPSDPRDWRGLPIIFDEVFTGIYRLGRPSAASFLGVTPDISAHAKLLTGGLLPLSLTMASESIFNAFLSAEKSEALLHGHSYTAHPMGCEVGRESLRKLGELEREGEDWGAWKRDWAADREVGQGEDSRSGQGLASTSTDVWSCWSKQFVGRLSGRDDVERVWALGSVLAVTLVDRAGSGYTSTATAGLQRKLMAEAATYGWGVHSRVLGNVIYFMASQTSTSEVLAGVETMIWRSL
ncbi:PLP-dependent transferase [Eremomyces bilateralis CBS 781.70]|uniref:PLP-dependent transferase n=1 Tax=Eremomyces bilateralis CBS 781.70 TaxID=1392243 RepID=A0A6G1FXG4_9PEZI|nr:PLP-dependent transferase [Eremomyces bilateralis CBS 781.70]KAF1810370.1 PLP-dependent transferase [Eremomyces bilateralis CBS 781.70]